jgi:hypothetical protein
MLIAGHGQTVKATLEQRDDAGIGMSWRQDLAGKPMASFEFTADPLLADDKQHVKVKGNQLSTMQAITISGNRVKCESSCSASHTSHRRKRQNAVTMLLKL